MPPTKTAALINTATQDKQIIFITEKTETFIPKTKEATKATIEEKNKKGKNVKIKVKIKVLKPSIYPIIG